MNSELKIIVLGNSNVGKTSLISKLTDRDYKSTSPTVSVDIVNLNFKQINRNYEVKLWDTIGQEKFKSFQKMVFQGSMAAILIYDITNQDSFKELETYFNYLNEICNGNLPKYILGNKKDLINIKSVNTLEAEEFSKINNCKFKEISIYETPKNTLLKVIVNLIEEIEKNEINITQKSQINNLKEEDFISQIKLKDKNINSSGCC